MELGGTRYCFKDGGLKRFRIEVGDLEHDLEPCARLRPNFLTFADAEAF